MKPDWWPKNPYPESVFPMTLDEYCEAVPDGDLRTAISGCLGRTFWSVASEDIFIRMCEAVDERVLGIELGPCDGCPVLAQDEADYKRKAAEMRRMINQAHEQLSVATEEIRVLQNQSVEIRGSVSYTHLTLPTILLV